MGEKNNIAIGGETGNGTETKSNSSTKSAGNNRGGKRGGGGGTAKSQSEIINEKGVGLPDVKGDEKIVISAPPIIDSPVSPPIEEPKKGRGRPKKDPNATAAKAKSKQTASVDPTQFILILQTVSNIIASREGLHMFALTKQEAESIATPLASILSRNESVGEFAGEYADHIALLIAAATIFIPKVLIYQAMNPKKEMKVKSDERTTSGSSQGVTRPNGNTGDVQNDVGSFNGTINSILSPIN